MASEYLFFLDGIQVSEPIGWNESKRKLKRSQKFKGIFIEYINDLTFHSDGYTYLNDILTTDASYYYGFCTDVVIEIKYRCSEFDNYENYFDGIIKLEDAEQDLDKCQIKVNIEDNSLSQLLETRAEIAVSFDSVETINGEVLQGFTDTSKQILNTSLAGFTRTGYEIFQSFEYILSYISDNRIGFISDYFSSTTGQLNRYFNTIIFTNPAVDLIGAGTIVVIYKNAFNENITFSLAKSGTVAATLNEITAKFNFNSTGTAAEKFYTQDNRFINKATNNGTTTITLNVDIQGFQLISISGAAYSFGTTDGKFQYGFTQRGASGLRLYTGNQLRDENTAVPLISFEELFEEMDKLFDLGMSLSTVYGVTTLRIEPISYFFDTDINISLTNVPGIIIKKSKEYQKNIIDVGDGNDNKGVVGNQSQPNTWITLIECATNKLNIKGNYITDSDEIEEQLVFTEDTKDDKIFLIEFHGLTGSALASTYENRIYSSITGTYTSYYPINGYLNNYWRLINWFFNIENNPKYKNYYITNNISNHIRRIGEFIYPLSNDDIENVFNNKELLIKFNSGTNITTEYSGWIDEVEFENTTGLCTFKLLTI